MKYRLILGFLIFSILPVFCQNLYLHKTKLIGNDNFVWYRVQAEHGINKTGALSERGEIIIPTEFLSVEYEYGFFDVTKSIGDNTFYHGVYTKTGNCIIPVSRGYTHIISFSRASDHDEYKYHEVVKGNKSGICNHYGVEIVPVVYQKVEYNVLDNTCEVITNTGEVKVINVGTNGLPNSDSKFSMPIGIYKTVSNVTIARDGKILESKTFPRGQIEVGDRYVKINIPSLGKMFDFKLSGTKKTETKSGQKRIIHAASLENKYVNLYYIDDNSPLFYHILFLHPTTNIEYQILISK